MKQWSKEFVDAYGGGRSWLGPKLPIAIIAGRVLGRSLFRFLTKKHEMASNKSGIPPISAPLMGGFHKFLPRFLKGKFHSVAVNSTALASATIRDADSIVFYANHASWWDPMMAMLLANRVFPQFKMYAPIDADALEKYKIFKKMGFYPVQKDSSRGAAEFLKTSRTILQIPGNSIWMTPEGRFVDPRETGVPFMPGLSHLAARIAGAAEKQEKPRVWFVALAIEYVFWEESKPELLAWFAPPVQASVDSVAGSDVKQAWNEQLQSRLRSAQAGLKAASISRDSSQFEILLGGEAGSFFIYDLWRRSTGWISGRKVDLSHSDKLAGK